MRVVDRVEAAVPALCGVSLAALVLASRYLPMTDLPCQEETVSILRHLGDRARFPSGLYVLNLGHPKQLFHIAAWALSLVVSTDVAVKLVVALSVFLIPVGAGALARHMGRWTWCALLSAPLAIGWAFYWGLTANLLGLGLWLTALPALDRGALGSRKDLARSTTWMAVLYGAHESTLLLGVLALSLFVAARARNLREGARASPPILFGVAIGLFQEWYKERLDLPWGRFGDGKIHFVSLVSKLRAVHVNVFGNLEPESVMAISAVYVACFAALLAASWRERRRDAAADTVAAAPARAAWRAVVDEHRYLVLTVACALAFLLGPVNLGFGNWVYQRFLAPGLALAACLVAPRAGHRAALHLRALAVAVPVATLLVALPVFADASRLYSDLDRLLPRIEPGSSIVELRGGVAKAGRNYGAATGASRAVAERGGRSMFTFAYVDYSPVIMRRKYIWAESAVRIGDDSMAFEPSRDLRRYRYVLLHAPSTEAAMFVAIALNPEARMVDTSGEWMLLESTLPVLPLTAADELPRRHAPGATLGERIARIDAARHADMPH